MDNKITRMIIFIIVGLIGSFVTFYASNIFFAEISNIVYTFMPIEFVAAMPLMAFGIDTIVVTVFIFRWYRRPQYRKASLKFYSIFIWAISFVGIITSLVTGIVYFGSFTTSYPFKGATLVCLIGHTLALCGSIASYAYADKVMPEDTEKRKMTRGYVIYSILLTIMVFLAYNRFGGIMWSITFMSTNTLYKTWPVYLGLIVPMAQLIHTLLFSFDVYKKKPKSALIYAWILLGLTTFTNVYTIVVGYSDTQFISAISPLFALERMASVPLDVIVLTILTTAVSIYALIYSYKFNKKQS